MSANYSLILCTFKPVTWLNFHHITLVLFPFLCTTANQRGDLVPERCGLLRKSKDSILLPKLPEVPTQMSLIVLWQHQHGGNREKDCKESWKNPVIGHDIVILLNCKVKLWATHVCKKKAEFKLYHIVKINFLLYSGLAQKLVSRLFRRGIGCKMYLSFQTLSL